MVIIWTYVLIIKICYSLRNGAHLADICAKKIWPAQYKCMYS